MTFVQWSVLYHAVITFHVASYVGFMAILPYLLLCTPAILTIPKNALFYSFFNAKKFLRLKTC